MLTPEQEQLLQHIKALDAALYEEIRTDLSPESRYIYAVGTGLAALSLTADILPPELRDAIADLIRMVEAVFLDDTAFMPQ